MSRERGNVIMDGQAASVLRTALSAVSRLHEQEQRTWLSAAPMR
jgi:hypothetical protein